MASYSYWFRLTDFAERPFPQAVPNVWVEGPDGVFGPNGVLARRRVPVVITEGGAAVVELVASTDTSPPVRYVLRCEWLNYDAISGKNTPAGWGSWEFTALAGGGDIKDMVTAAPSVFWVGPPWPDPIRPGIYIDRVTNDVGEVKP